MGRPAELAKKQLESNRINALYDKYGDDWEHYDSTEPDSVKQKASGPSYIVRAKVDQEFVIVPNEVAQDVKMSLSAKGLLLCLLSLPEGWRIYKREIHSRCCNNGRNATVKAFNELIRLRYIKQVRRSGNLIRYDYFVYPYRFNEKVKLKKPRIQQTGR